MDFEPGRLDKCVVVQSRSSTKDAYGHELNSWSEVGTVWANIKPGAGSERVRAMQVAGTVSHTVLVRYAPAFTPPKGAAALRILYGSRVFNVLSAINEEEQNRWIIFVCEEGTLSGQ